MSGVLAIAEPRRIKAAHRRRWKAATGHRPYANNNPYTFTDPDGRVAKSRGSSNNLCLIGGCDAGSFSASEGSSQKQETAKEPPSRSFSQWIDGVAKSINPFMASAECVRDGCGAGGWAMAGIALIDLLPSPRDAAQVGVRTAAKNVVDVTSKPRTVDAALTTAGKWLKPGYTELGKSGSGVYRSADGLRQFRMSPTDISGAHGKIGSHVHFEKFNSVGDKVKNIHTPLVDP